MGKHAIKNTQQKLKMKESDSKPVTTMKQELQRLWQKVVPGAGGDSLSAICCC
jgi:hypothetical protein